MIKTRNPENADIELDFYPFSYPKQNNSINSTCNAIFRAEYRMFDRKLPVFSIHQVINKVDKALQVLKRVKLDFVSGYGTVSGKISLKPFILTDDQYNFISQDNIQMYHNPFKIEEYQKSVFKEVIKDMRLYQKSHKLMDIYAYICQAKTNELTFNFKDFWTVLAEANFPNSPGKFIDECKRMIRNELPDRLFLDTKIFLNNSLQKKSLTLPDSEYYLKQAILKQIGLNIPKKNSFNAEKFKLNYKKLKKYTELEFLNDILAELDGCQNKPEKYKEKIDKWLENTIWSAFAERNLESHNNISTDYSLIKLKDEFLYIGKIFLLSKIKEPKKSKKPHNI